MVPAQEPSGGRALAIDQTDSTLIGVPLISPAGWNEKKAGFIPTPNRPNEDLSGQCFIALRVLH